MLYITIALVIILPDAAPFTSAQCLLLVEASHPAVLSSRLEGNHVVPGPADPSFSFGQGVREN